MPTWTLPYLQVVYRNLHNTVGTWRASPAARRASAMVRLGSEMAMATEAKRTVLGLVAGLSREASTSLNDLATFSSELGKAGCARNLQVMSLAGAIGFFTPGHTLALKLAVRCYGKFLYRPTRAVRGLARSSSSAFARGPVETRDTHEENDITIIIFRIVLTGVFPNLTEEKDARLIMMLADTAIPSNLYTGILNTAGTDGRERTAGAYTGLKVGSADAVDNGNCIIITIYALCPAADKEKVDQKDAATIEDSTILNHVRWKLRSCGARVPKLRAKKKRPKLLGCNLALTSRRSFRPKCACKPVAPEVTRAEPTTGEVVGTLM